MIFFPFVRHYFIHIELTTRWIPLSTWVSFNEYIDIMVGFVMNEYNENKWSQEHIFPLMNASSYSLTHEYIQPSNIEVASGKILYSEPP